MSRTASFDILGGMGNFRADSVPVPAVRRLSLYLRQLESLERRGIRTVSSRQLGASLGFTDAQVRRDLTYFGQFGQPGIGYRVEALIQRLRQILGTDRSWDVLLVGVGNLGRALASYKGFEKKGFRLRAVFDADPAKVGRKCGPLVIRPMSELRQTVRELGIRLAILTVPADQAQAVADELAAAGIKGLLNFAPAAINVPPDMALEAVDLAVQLEQLSFAVSFASRSQQGVLGTGVCAAFPPRRRRRKARGSYLPESPAS